LTQAKSLSQRAQPADVHRASLVDSDEGLVQVTSFALRALERRTRDFQPFGLKLY
jgi:hypothetical protein